VRSELLRFAHVVSFAELVEQLVRWHWCVPAAALAPRHFRTGRAGDLASEDS
jgi:hypothetical protein